MPKIVIMTDGTATREVVLTQERTTLGRRPTNDVVLDQLAVSGQHAVLTLRAGQVQVEDLGSTNGTYVNGAAVEKQLLANGDLLEMGKVKMRFETDVAEHALQAKIRVVSGAGAGREMPLTKPVSTFGKPGVAVAAITRRAQKYWLHQQEGTAALTLNGVPVGAEPTLLHAHDDIVLAGVAMQFLLF